MRFGVKNTIALFLVAGLFVPSLKAQDNAGQAGEFLRWGVGGKALGLGRAFTSIADDASSLYWNPAGMSALSRIGGTFMFMHVPLHADASFNFLGGAIPLRLFFVRQTSTNPVIAAIQDVKLGVGLVWLSQGNFLEFNDEAVAVDDLSNNSISESGIYLSFAYPLNPLLNMLPIGGNSGVTGIIKGDIELGVTTKFIRQGLFEDDGSATSFDIGLKYSHRSGFLNLGFVLRDFTTPNLSYKDGSRSDKIPSNGTIGISVIPPIGRLRGLMLSYDYSVVRPSGRDRDKMFGVEYDLSVIDSNWPVKLRVGTNSNYESFTLGINFSPEEILGRDWVPSGDYAYANDRGRFDATGERLSFSVDRNPFTARYWYQNGMVQFFGIECGDLSDLKDNDRIPKYMMNAELAKNPGDRAYRYEAALRTADVEFLNVLGELQGSSEPQDLIKERTAKRFQKISNSYQTRVNHFLKMDYGKAKVDEAHYFRSFTYFVQSLILSGRSEEAIAHCMDKGRSWGKHIDVTEFGASEFASSRSESINYLLAFALYKAGRASEALRTVTTNLPEEPMGKFLLGHILFLQGKYNEALSSLEEIDLNDSWFSKDVFLPLTADCSFGDEVLFLRAASLYKLTAQQDVLAVIDEFAKIPRFFPESDFAKFLMNGDKILSNMIAFYEQNDLQKIHDLLDKVLASYKKTFSNGTLVEKFYNYSYR